MPNPSVKKPFVHLHVHSAYSFLDGASHVEALVRCAAQDEQPALALTDHDNLCGAPQFSILCRKSGIKPIHSAELTLDTGRVVALAKTRKGFSSLCRLLTHAHLQNERGKPVLPEEYFLENAEDIILLAGETSAAGQAIQRGRHEQAYDWMRKYRQRFNGEFFIEIKRTFEPLQKHLNCRLSALGQELHIPFVATNNVHYAASECASAQDLLCCIRHLTRVDEPHPDRKINAELSLKTSEEMAELFADWPEAVSNTVRIAEYCEDYEIGEKRFRPRFITNNRQTSADELHQLTYQGARKRYGEITSALKSRLDYELRIISDLGFADYFLVVRDLVQFARAQKIRHAGRGSAADSVVAYCLDITKVDAFKRNLRFERFINPERAENLPDIDIDFDARYRDDVTAYVTNRYGRDHTATVCTYARFRARSAIRDTAKALGFAVEDVDRLAKSTHWAVSARKIREALKTRPELRALNVSEERFHLLFDLCEALHNIPRHISTHLGGVVITGDPIWEISPLQMAAKGVQIIQYDKDGVEDLKLLKLDLLCLRMLGAVEDSVVMIAENKQEFDLDNIPDNDPDTYEMIQAAETVGAFQIESPAQMSLHPRLKTRTYEDIVASVALIRPGPVKGEMVEPFVRRRNLLELPASIHPAIDRILEHTYGVVLYQEQVVSIAVELAGFTPGQADTLRRTISHHRSGDRMQEIGEIFVAQTVSNGVEKGIAERVFSWLQGYAGYGFCEAHAAAFGDTSYRTAYLLAHHPAEFYAAILNNEPMGFYPAETIVNEARRRNVRVLNPSVNFSMRDFTVESGAIRTGLKQIKGISDTEIETLLKLRPFQTLEDFLLRCSLPRDILENLVLCGALDEFGSNRRASLFILGEINNHEGELNLFSEIALPDLPDFSLYEKLGYEWDILGFSPAQHPIAFWRDALTHNRITANEEIRKVTDQKRVLRAAGWVIRPHTPPTKSGKTVVFFSLEDETGLLNVTVFPDAYERFGHLIYHNPFLVIEGRKDRRGTNSLVAETIRECRLIEDRGYKVTLK